MVDIPQGNVDFKEIIARRMNKARNLSELAWLLERFMSECDVIEHHGKQTLIFKRARVDRIGAMTIEVYSNEHAPPHFHVKASDIDAVFAISDCQRLQGSISSKNERLIKLWHSGAKTKLIEMWNRTRPDNCPVGPI
jgi:Domain of unknown function (DUF4160)